MRLWIALRNMSPTDPNPELPENAPSHGEGTDDPLVRMAPGAVERRPIPGLRTKQEEEPVPADDSPADTPPPTPAKPVEAPATTVKKKKHKVHSPGHTPKPSPAALAFANDPDLANLPDLPEIHPFPSPDSEEPVAEAQPLNGDEDGVVFDAGAEGDANASADVPGGAVPDDAAAPGDPARIEPATDSPAEDAAGTPAVGAPKWTWNAGEMKWMIVLLVGMLVVGGFFYAMLRSGLPADSTFLARTNPSLPIKGEKVTIGDLKMDWKDIGSGSLAGGLKSSTLFPRISLRFNSGSTGAVRIFFKDEREHQAGDTVNVDLSSGALETLVTCTVGLRSRLEYDDLRSRNLAHWTIEIHEGPNPQSPLSEFKLLCRLAVPWNLDRKTSP